MYETVDVNESTFILIHAGLGNYSSNKKISEYTAEELLLSRDPSPAQHYNDDSIYVISGHTPTQYFTEKPEIYFNGHDIHIDCGAAFGGKLGCLCLENMKTFYA